MAASGKRAVIPPRRNRTNPAPLGEEDRLLYKQRHRIENFFGRLKDWRGIATRYEKTARNFLAGIHLAASLTWISS